MLGRLYESQDCSASRALEIVGERWSLLILRDAIFAGATRFSQFHTSLGLATNVLSKRLDGFVADGLMQRHEATGQPAEYLLTDKGRAFKPVIMALTEWGDRWSDRPGPIKFCDSADGEPTALVVRRISDGSAVPEDRVTVALRDRA